MTDCEHRNSELINTTLVRPQKLTYDHRDSDAFSNFVGLDLDLRDSATAPAQSGLIVCQAAA